MSDLTLEQIEDAVLNLAEAFTGVKNGERLATLAHLSVAQLKVVEAIESYRAYLKTQPFLKPNP